MIKKRILFTLIAILGFSLQVKSMEIDRDNEYPSRGFFTSLSYVDQLRNSHVTQLDLSRDQDLQNIDFIRFFPNLRDLDLSNSELGNKYKPIAQLKKLERLNLFFSGVTTAKYLMPLVNLNYLKISVPSVGKAVKYLFQLPKLEDLDIGGGFLGVEKIAQLTSLKKLKLRGVFNKEGEEDVDLEVPSLKFLSSLTQLRELDLSGNDYIFYIKPLVKLPCLKRLNLSGNKNIRDLRRLSKLTSLVRLDLSCMNSTYIPTLLEDLAALTELPNLKILIVSPSIELPKFPKRVRIRYNQ